MFAILLEMVPECAAPNGFRGRIAADRQVAIRPRADELKSERAGDLVLERRVTSELTIGAFTEAFTIRLVRVRLREVLRSF